MEIIDTFKNTQEKAIENQLNRMTAYGIEEFEVTPIPKSSVGNEDIDVEKKGSQE